MSLVRRTTHLVGWAVLCCLSTIVAHAAKAGALSAALESIKSEDLRRHTNVLASDTFEGREAGSRGGKAAGVYLTGELKKLRVNPGNGKLFYQHFGYDYRNVLALLPGRDPVLKREYIIVGAHYDHVGYGTARNSRGPIGSVHNGADDNASGTAGLLELAEAFCSFSPGPKRSVMFAFWDAEEKGLLGSKHWADHPTVSLDRVKLMVNLDMIGRLRGSTLEVYGIRTAGGLRRLLSEQNRNTDLDLEFNWDNRRDSDHYPFFTRRIPFVMFHTKKHEDYHRPSDDVGKLNLRGMQRVVRLLFQTVHTAANAPKLRPFRLASRGEDQSIRREQAVPLPPLPSRLGISWDADLDKQGIIQLTRVAPGSPAERAGLRIGDRILKFGSHRIAEIGDFLATVLAAKDQVSVLVQRDGESQPRELSAGLNGSPHRLGISWREDDAEPGCITLTRVIAGSPADRAGLKPNHRIYAVSGQTFESGSAFDKLVSTLKSPLRLLVECRGRLRDVRLHLPTQPKTAVTEISPRADKPGRREP